MNNEYCEKFNGVIRKMSAAPCPHQCVIPVLTIETSDGLKNVAGCFVHVMQNNTTYYIDDKHRIITVWAGPVFYNNYDPVANPFDLRGQVVYDFENNKMYIFNQQKEYRTVNLTEA